MLRVRRRPRRWNLPACLRVDFLRACKFSRSLDEVSLTITREIAPVHAKPTGVTAVRLSQGSTPRKYATNDTYSSIFPVHKLRQTELTKDIRSKWRLWPLRPAVSCTRGGADWPKVVAVGAQQPISDCFGFIQMRDTLSTNGEHLRVAEVKSYPAIPKSMRSVNGDQNGANLKKWSVLLVCTIWKMTPLSCACALVITLETQKCRKKAPGSVEFKGSVEWSWHERHFCSLLPYFLLSWLQIFQLCLSFWTSSFDMVILKKFLQEKEKYPKNLPKRLSS